MKDLREGNNGRGQAIISVKLYFGHLTSSGFPGWLGELEQLFTLGKKKSNILNKNSTVFYIR